jgi:hypothetical protein
MFDTKLKTIRSVFLLAIMLSAGPIGCGGTQSNVSSGKGQLTLYKFANGDTINAADQSTLAQSGAKKFISDNNPQSAQKIKFDVAMEVQGIGITVDRNRASAYMRPGRTFSSDHRAGVQFRFRF